MMRYNRRCNAGHAHRRRWWIVVRRRVNTGGFREVNARSAPHQADGKRQVGDWDTPVFVSTPMQARSQ
jgi:hypothetical protein